MHEMDAEAFNFRRKVGVGVALRFYPAPVEVTGPVSHELLQKLPVGAVLPARPGQRGGPARVGEAGFEVTQDGVGGVRHERQDRGGWVTGSGHTCRAEKGGKREDAGEEQATLLYGLAPGYLILKHITFKKEPASLRGYAVAARH
ncbi:hypothetical protein GCM10023172_00210 [Hymenobacter ginsengisoli]|uniref:Uncharacterized protein n=1 Tax=Hymenobacter ginsengisoli TaxID=1051626 RepID=A0ABP8PVK1_9BACT